MSYEEKGKWVYLLVVLGTYTGYVTVVLSRADGTGLAGVSYAAPLLWSLGISVGLSVVGRILLEILRPSENYKVDARDKEIERFGEYVSGSVLGFSMIVPLGLTLAEVDYFWIANAIYLGLVLATVTGTLVKLGAYRRGL